jgi:methionyl-tRNA formyltransferase
MRSKPIVALIGNGTVIKSCVDIIRQHESVELALVLLRKEQGGWHQAIEAHCRRSGAVCLSYERITDPVVLEELVNHHVDFLVSVHNPDILPEAIFRTTPIAINFHPAPLPKYAGLNPFSWALLCGEQTYGVTWHLLSSKIDGGDIIAQRQFLIEPSWNVMKLMSVAHQQGLEILGMVLSRIAGGDLDTTPQDLTQRTYFSGAMKPFGGNFPFEAAPSTIENLARATSFYPAPNTFCMPKITMQKATFELARFGLRSQLTEAVPGTIVDISDTGIVFAAAGCTVLINVVRGADGMQRNAAEFAYQARLAVGDRAAMARDHYLPNGLPIHGVYR